MRRLRTPERTHVHSNAPRMLEWSASNTPNFQVGCFETGFSGSSADLFNKKLPTKYTPLAADFDECLYTSHQSSCETGTRTIRGSQPLRLSSTSTDRQSVFFCIRESLHGRPLSGNPFFDRRAQKNGHAKRFLIQRESIISGCFHSPRASAPNFLPRWGSERGEVGNPGERRGESRSSRSRSSPEMAARRILRHSGSSA